MRRLLVAVAVPSVIAAQAPVVPGLPEARVENALFTQVTGAYQYSGCVTSVVAYTPATGFVSGTAYCVHGLLLTGVRPDTFGAGFGPPTLAAYLAENVTWDPRIRAVYSEAEDLQIARGIVTSASCPVGCASAFQFNVANGGIGSQWWRSSYGGYIDPATQFAPQSIRLAIGYAHPGPFGSEYSSEYPVFTLTAVPEPASFALTLGGLAILSIGALRRRRSN